MILHSSYDKGMLVFLLIIQTSYGFNDSSLGVDGEQFNRALSDGVGHYFHCIWIFRLGKETLILEEVNLVFRRSLIDL